MSGDEDMEIPASETARTHVNNQNRSNSLSGIALTMNPTNPNIFLQLPFVVQQPSRAMTSTLMENINNSAISPRMTTITGSSDPSPLPPRRVTLHLGWTSGLPSSEHTKKIRTILRDSEVSVQDWLYDLITNDTQPYHFQALVDSLDDGKNGAGAVSFKLSLGPQRSMVIDMNKETLGMKRKRTNEDIIPCIRMELVTCLSNILLLPRDALYHLLDTDDENLELRAVREGRWSTSEGDESTNATNPASQKAKEGQGKCEADTTPKKAKTSIESIERSKSINVGGASSSTLTHAAKEAKRGNKKDATAKAEAKGSINTTPAAKKAKKGLEKSALKIAEATAENGNVVETGRSDEGDASINITTPATEKSEEGTEKDNVDITKAKKSKEIEETASKRNKHKASLSRVNVSPAKNGSKVVEKAATTIEAPVSRKLSAGSLFNIKENKRSRKGDESKGHPKEEKKESKGDTLPPFALGEWDVLTGFKNDHQSVGNRKYGEYIEKHFRDYRDEKPDGKKGITQAVMTKFTFYRMDKKSDEWKLVEVGESLRNKVQKDLRNRIKRENAPNKSEETTADNHSRRKVGDTNEQNSVKGSDVVQTKSTNPAIKARNDSGHDQKHDDEISDETEVGDVRYTIGRLKGTNETETASEAKSHNSKENANASNDHESGKRNVGNKATLDQSLAIKNAVVENDPTKKMESSMPSQSSSDKSSSSDPSSSTGSSSSSSSSGSDSSDDSDVSDDSKARNVSNMVNATIKVIKSTPPAKLSATKKMPNTATLSSSKANTATNPQSPQAKTKTSPLTSPRAMPEKIAGMTNSTRRKKPLLDPEMKFKFQSSKRRTPTRKRGSTSEIQGNSTNTTKESRSTNSAEV
jgi:hypothetical protein